MEDVTEVIKGYTVTKKEMEGLIFVYVDNQLVNTDWNTTRAKLTVGEAPDFASELEAISRLSRIV